MKDIKIWWQSQGKETLEKLKQGNFDIYWGIIVIMIGLAIFQGIVPSSIANAANQGKCAQIFVNLT